MKKFKESEHPRDKEGKFTKKELEGMSAKELSDKLKIDLDDNVSITKPKGNETKLPTNLLIKGINSYNKRIKEHEEYIKNPKIKYNEWDIFSQDRKERIISYWQREIKAFKNSIKKYQYQIDIREGKK